MERTGKQGENAAFFLVRSLAFAYLLTGALLMLLAFLVYKAELGEKAVSIVITAIYVAATFLAGFTAGRKLQSRKFLWGLLEGLAYFAVLAVVSWLFGEEGKETGNSFLTTLVLCGAGGMLGGMLG